MTVVGFNISFCLKLLVFLSQFFKHEFSKKLREYFEKLQTIFRL